MFVKTITRNLGRADLKDFYITSDRISVDDRGFQKFFVDATKDSAISPAENVTYHFHTTLENAHDNDNIALVGEKLIDLSTTAGRVEARRRLNFLKHLIQDHQNRKPGELLVNAYRNSIGWFKLETGDALAVGCYLFRGGNQWRCISWPLQRHSAGGYYFSGVDKVEHHQLH